MGAAKVLRHQSNPAPKALVAVTKTMAIRMILAVTGTNFECISIPFGLSVKHQEPPFPAALTGKNTCSFPLSGMTILEPAPLGIEFPLIARLHDLYDEQYEYGEVEGRF